jgi:hypothetical protein
METSSKRSGIAAQRIAYINGHGGTSDNFKYLSNLLNFSFAELSPRIYNDFGQTNKKAHSLLAMKFGDFFCNAFDIVVVGDTNPDARFLLNRIDQSPDVGETDFTNKKQPCQLKRLIMESTYRFDAMLHDEKDRKEYYDLIARLAKRKDNKIYWVANNPWEPKHAEMEMGGKFFNVRAQLKNLLKSSIH